MGNCLSGGPAQLLEDTDGDEEAYNKRFLEDQVLGQGEFGVVKMVHDMTANQQGDENAAPLACKVLRKGVVFKDNTLYSPLKPEVLRGEIEMLRTLAGECFCLKLEAVYETHKCLFVVTEYCAGGELFSYVAQLESDLRTEDVSRIAYQLLSSVDHCYKHKILHRDIKPENIMFTDAAPGAQLRLIDFGSGTIDNKPVGDDVVMFKGMQMHKTFAGSAFYISPEMFQRTYTSLTDVWSVGATLYVLVAGYPADALQKAFNILQDSGKRDLRMLPGLPDDMPDSYYELLSEALTYRYKHRPTAGTLLKQEFVTFHKELEDAPGLSLEAIAAAAQDSTAPKDSSTKRTASISVTGSVVRHNLFLGFQKFERAVTTLLAAMLPKGELEQLLAILQERTSVQDSKEGTKEDEADTNEQKLSVLHVSELKAILRDDLKNDQVLETMSKIPNADLYDSFAYHTSLLNDFGLTGNAANLTASLGKGQGRRSFSARRGSNFLAATGHMTNSNSSQRSTSSLRSFRGRSNASKRGRSSVHGTSLFKSKSATSKNRPRTLSK